jgi:hypothetical protein
MILIHEHRERYNFFFFLGKELPANGLERIVSEEIRSGQWRHSERGHGWQICAGYFASVTSDWT